jgi:ABC-2 type transport system ATP-binding protein
VAPAVEAVALTKSYASVPALRGVDLSVDAGDCVALLGPNGAGKTTLVEILEGFRSRDSGEALVLGVDPATGGRALRERIGIVLQSAGIDPFLTVAEVVALYAGYYPKPLDPAGVIELVGLTEKSGSRVKTLSGGQQRRLDLALGIVGDPELLFLDEPTTGFDPGARRGAWQIVSDLRNLGKTVVLTTHYLDEAQHLADRVVVLVGGRIVADGPPDEIGRHADERTIVRFGLPAGVAAGDLPLPARPEGDAFVVETVSPTADLHRLTSWAVERGVEVPGLTVTRPTLEDVYLELTGPTEEQGHE